MKSATFVSSVAAALLLVTSCLGAQPDLQGPPKIRVDVPFDFMVGQVMFPAGIYIVKPLPNRAFSLQASHGRESVSFRTQPLRTTLHPQTARLIFAKERGHYHLRELWMNSAIGVEALEPGVAQVDTSAGSSVEVLAACTTCQ
jgi:hypothetical protein